MNCSRTQSKLKLIRDQFRLKPCRQYWGITVFYDTWKTFSEYKLARNDSKGVKVTSSILFWWYISLNTYQAFPYYTHITADFNGFAPTEDVKCLGVPCLTRSRRMGSAQIMSYTRMHTLNIFGKKINRMKGIETFCEWNYTTIYFINWTHNCY